MAAKVSTPAEVKRQVAKHWLELPGIENLPEFYAICREIIENDDDWFKNNWPRIRGIENSRDARLFLIERGALNTLALMMEAFGGEDEEIRHAAKEKLSEWLQSEEGKVFIKGRYEHQFSETYLIQHLFDDAKFFLKVARFFESKDEHKAKTFVRASVIAAFAALEGLVNTSCQLLAEGGDLELHELCFLQEQKLELTDEGYFEARGQRFNRLEQKIVFLHWKSQGVAIDRGGSVWSGFKSAKALRNEIVHPKPGEISYADLTTARAESALRGVMAIASQLFPADGNPPEWLRTLEPSELLRFDGASPNP